MLSAVIRNDTLAPLNLTAVYLHNAQLTGTSSSTLADLKTAVLDLAARLAPAHVWTGEAEALLIESLWEP